MARPDFRAVAARRLSEERELSPSIVSLLSAEGSKSLGVRHVPVDRIEPNPGEPPSPVRGVRARRARRVDPGARRPPADPRPPDGRTTSTSSWPGSAAGEPAIRPASPRSPPSSRSSTTTRPSRSPSSRTSSARTCRRSRKRRCTRRWSRTTATASASSPRSWARTRATWRTGSAWRMPPRRSARWCPCAKTPSPTPTS